MRDLREFTRAYLEAAIWTECGPDSSEGMQNSDWTQNAIDEAASQCAKFMACNSSLLTKAYMKGDVDYTPSQAGHDFWLSRNNHGTGFWDRGLEEIGDYLSNACGWRTLWAEVNVYEMDGELYFE